jgi:hypothetical protein
MIVERGLNINDTPNPAQNEKHSGQIKGLLI